LRGILDGLTNKEIGGRLQVSEAAVKAGIQELFNKAGVRTRGQLVKVAIENTQRSGWTIPVQEALVQRYVDNICSSIPHYD
jgi:hypothetical protein